MAKEQRNDAKCPDPGPLSPPATWASAELIEKTRRVWAAEYGRPVDEAEAMKILSKAGKLFKALYPELDGRK
jgi:hypothetical protein